MLVLFLFTVLFAQSLSQLVTKDGSCPRHDPVSAFDENKLLGDWFEWSRINNYYEPDHACTIFKYQRGHDGHVVEQIRAIIRSPGTEISWEGRLIARDRPPSGVYHMAFPRHSLDPGFTATFVSANWDHWLILHGCKQKRDEIEQFVWVLVKNVNLEQRHQNEINRALRRIDISPQSLIRDDHNNCPRRRR